METLLRQGRLSGLGPAGPEGAGPGERVASLAEAWGLQSPLRFGKLLTP